MRSSREPSGGGNRAATALGGAALVASLTFAADGWIGRGVATPVLYVLAVALVGATGKRGRVWQAAALCTALTLIGRALPASAGPGPQEWANRGLAVAAIWITAALCVRRMPASELLRPARPPRDAAASEAGASREQQHLAEVAAANAKFRSLFDQSSVFAGILSVEGTVLEANRLSLEGCGYRAEDVLGKPFWETGWWSGSEEVQDAIRRAVRKAANGETYRRELHYWWADGTERVVDFCLHPVHDEQGRIFCLHPTGADITARKAAEERLRRHAQTFTRLVDWSPFGIYVVDSHFRIAQVSAGARAAFRNVDPLIGRDFSEVMHILWPEPFASEAIEVLRNTLETGEAYVAPSLRERRIDTDTTESYEWQLHRVTLPDGEYWVVCYFFDSTDIREAEQALRESEQRAQQHSQAKSEFLANMSHEIRTPMTAILGHVDLLLARLTDARDRECAATIQRNGGHLLELINDILDLSRIEAGKLGLELAPCDPARLLVDLEALMKVRVDDEAVEFRVRADGPVPSTIRTDEKRLRQVLINLVGNAIKFTERGRVEVCMKLLGAGQAGPRLRFEVVDTGIGIAPENLAEILEPFSQADSSGARRYGGSGLGLAICKRLVLLLDGELRVESEVGRGSTFSVTIPIGSLEGVPISPVDLEQHPRRDEAEPHAPGELSCRVLLVDDHQDVRAAAQLFLEDAGAVVVTAEDGGGGIEAVQAAAEAGEPFDVVLMDMQMPRMDGYTAVSRLRARGFQRPIVALTAAALPSDRERCLVAGCDEYLAKPLERGELVALVQRVTSGLSDSPAPTVLVVEDNIDAAQATVSLLRARGFGASAVHDGAQAMRAVVDLKPAIVLLDIGLPDGDGRALARRLRSEGYTGALIALSGRSGVAEEQRSLEAGCDRHLVKPAEPAELLRLVREAFLRAGVSGRGALIGKADR